MKKKENCADNKWMARYKKDNIGRAFGCQKTYTARQGRIIDPSDKAKVTTNSTNYLGRITAKQIEFLTQKGYGDDILKWTKYKAHKIIEKLCAE